MSHDLMIYRSECERFDDLIMLYYVMDFTLSNRFFVFRHSSFWFQSSSVGIGDAFFLCLLMLFSGDSFWRLYCCCLFFSFVYSGFVLKLCEQGVLGQAF